ncbi:MAG TPA: NmrA/HSCARG family protein [Pseudonocardiaceae bacterium]|nr:NmrA/HSCARG family protein [Pseudonocardiaceae bacterium]
MNSKTILVVGATGNQGGATVDALRATDFAVRALVRGGNSHKSAEGLRARGAEIVPGDLDDADSLADAMRGAYGVFSAINFANGGVALEEERGKRVADVASASGVEHFVYSSVGGAERESGVPHFESKWRIEEHIRRIGLPHSIIRPTTFMANLNEMPGLLRFVALSMSRSAMNDANPLQLIAIADIGRWAAHMFTHPAEYLGAAVEIAGDAVTFEQMIESYQQVYGRTPRSMSLPASWLLRGDAGRMFTWISKEGYRADLARNRAAIPDLLTFQRFLALRQPS